MASVWEELKRRNVVKVAVAYAIVGWILIEISATVFPILKLPEWTVTFVTMLVLLGFPVALILSWAFELTPDGFKPSHEVEQSASIAPVTGQKLNYAIIGFLVFAVGFMFLDNYILEDDSGDPQTVAAPGGTERERNAATVDTEKSIAVLAFVNMSNDPEQEYFSDGIAEEILNGLVKVDDLRVVARTSAFSFKGKNIDVREIGETLNVSHVLEGSVRKAGDQLRITAQLINVDDGYHLWSETFDRQADDIFAIQEEIARAVVGELEVTLDLADEVPLLQQGTTNTEAYNWFLRGKFYIGQQSAEAFEKAIESYTRAIEIDPGFAGGHGGLAYGLAYAGSIFYPYSDVKETVRTAYERALAIDDNQSEALLAKAVDAALTDYNFVVAETAIRRALALGNNNTLVTDAYWWIVLTNQRRFDEALEHLANAERNDPLSSLVQQGMGHNFLLKGEYRASLPYSKAALELNPNDFLASYNLSLAYINLGRFDEAESVIRQMEATNSLDGAALSAWVALHIARGEEAEAHEKLERIVALYDAAKNPFLLGFICDFYLRLSNIDEGIDWCERAVDIRSGASGILAARFYRDPVIWNNPSIQALLKKMNLDDASVAAAIAAMAEQ